MKNRGFTIVELLVVIVVIGILAAITVVSYTGISQKAAVASIQSDLNSSSNLLKMYYTEYGSYPIGNNMSEAFNSDKCPTAPTLNTKYCLKLSNGNTVDSYIGSAPTFSLTIANGTIKYTITDTTAPTIAVSTTVPAAPNDLTTTLNGLSSLILGWLPPSSDGGSTITGYKIYRGLSSGNETLINTLPNVTSYTDTGLSRDTLYYYRVTALNSVGESQYSNEVSSGTGLGFNQ